MTVKHLVSLGGSFAAGIGLPPWTNPSTMRSTHNYAQLVAQRLGARLTDMSACGADSANMHDTRQASNSMNPLSGERLPPQLTGITGDVDLVTITAPSRPKQRLGRFSWPVFWAMGDTSVLVAEHEHVNRTASNLEQLIKGVQKAAPRARIVLVDYLSPFGKATRAGESVPFDSATIAAVRELTSQINWAVKLATQQTGVDLVEASKLGIGHELGSAEEWITRLDVEQSILP